VVRKKFLACWSELQFLPVMVLLILIHKSMDIQIIDIKNHLSWTEILRKLRHDTYHLPEYIAIEAKRTNTIPEAIAIVDGDKIFFAPYLLRSCDDIVPQESNQKIFDVVSPYGYPGMLLSEAGANTPGFPEQVLGEFKRVLREKNVCAAFFRMHPILSDKFNEIFAPSTFTANGETVSVDLTLSESQIWAHTRKGHQSTINKCKRLGFTGRIVNYRQYINEFIAIYEETMNRVKAKQSYYFDRAYFEDLSKLEDKIHLCLIELDNEIASACLFFECCGIVQAHLGGTKNQFLNQSPFNLMLDYVRYWAKERGNEFLHLGGGVGGSTEDSLYTFKSGFSRQRHNFMTLRLVTDEKKYSYLVELRAKHINIQPEQLLNSDFFPAYRSPK
jgi:hypothetical protein